MVQFIRDSTFM